MILIAYDGTSSSDHAIAVAGALLRGGRAHVIYVWEPLSEPRDAFAFAGAIPPVGAPVDNAIERQGREALTIAETGAALARASGFDADGDAVRGAGSQAQTLEEEVDRLRPELVVIGSRGLLVPPLRPTGE